MGLWTTCASTATGFSSCSPYSVIVTLASKADESEFQPHPKVFETLLRRAARETQARRGARALRAHAPASGGVKKCGDDLPSHRRAEECHLPSLLGAKAGLRAR